MDHRGGVLVSCVASRVWVCSGIVVFTPFISTVAVLTAPVATKPKCYVSHNREFHFERSVFNVDLSVALIFRSTFSSFISFSFCSIFLINLTNVPSPTPSESLSAHSLSPNVLFGPLSWVFTYTRRWRRKNSSARRARRAVCLFSVSTRPVWRH